MKLAGVGVGAGEGDTKWWSPRGRKHAVGRVEEYTGFCLSLGLSLQTEVSRASISQTPFLRVQIRSRDSTGPSGRKMMMVVRRGGCWEVKRSFLAPDSPLRCRMCN